VFSAGTGGRGLLGQRLGVLAPQGHEPFQGGVRMTWLSRVCQGTSNPSLGSCQSALLWVFCSE
jgi:hypothetical protein